MNCVLLCKSYRSSILTYDCDSRRGERERRRVRETSEREKREEVRSGCENVCEGEKCDYGVVMYGSRKSFLRAYRERRRRARYPDCTLSRIRKIREMWRNETCGDPRDRAVVKS
jgi:hypothetical protein